METNKVLKAGQLVKVLEVSEAMQGMGFVKGQFYEVKAAKAEGKTVLYVQRTVITTENGGQGDIALGLTVNGELTEMADYFGIHNCPVVLPQGVSK